MMLSLATLLLAVTSTSAAPSRTFVHQAPTMGTVATLQIVSADSTRAGHAAAAALEALARVDSLMSNWTATSEIARLNRRAGQRLTVQPEVSEVLAAALRIGRDSGGAFDVTVEPLVRLWGFLDGRPRVPAAADIEQVLASVGADRVHFDPISHALQVASPGTRLDLGGIAKGYGVDRAARALQAAGVANALVDVSGNMMPLGSPPGRDAWIVGVRDPFDRTPYFARLQLVGWEGIATSGDYEQFVSADGRRYGHILDPRTGRPTHELVAVTVLAPTAMEADAWATAFFVLGLEASRRITTERADLSAILVRAAHQGVHEVWIENVLRPRFTLEPGADATFAVRWY